jgi:glycosyltransferase involved in cell wall biosynthesis
LQSVVKAKDEAVAVQADEIHRLQTVVVAKDEAVAVQADEIHRLQTVIAAKDNAIAAQADEIHRLESVVVAKDNAIATQTSELRRRQSVVEELSRNHEHLSAENQQLRSDVQSKAAALETQGGQIVRLNEQVVFLEGSVRELRDSVARYQAWMKERNEQLSQLRQETDDLKAKLDLARRQLQDAEGRASDLARQLDELRSRPLVQMNEVWHAPWTWRTPLTLTQHAARTLIPQPKPGSDRAAGRCSASKRSTGPAGYRVKLPKAPSDGAPVIAHAIGNFWMGGSSRLIVGIIEGVGDRYHHRVFTSAVPAESGYLGVEPVLAPGVPSVQQAEEHLRGCRASILHFHYWGECDEPWYAAFVRAAVNLGIPIVENVNTPVVPLEVPGLAEMVHVSRYVQARFAGGRGMVIYPGSDFSLFTGSAERAARRDSVGMVYRLEDDKLGAEAIAPFIELARIRPQTKIYIVGGGSLLKPFQQRVVADGVGGSFVFTDYVSYESLPGWYGRFGVFVAPVRKESFGQVSPFAMSMGIPVVGYAVGAIPEIVNDPSLVAPAGDAAGLARLTAALLDDKARRIAIGKAHQQRAHDQFSLEAMIAAYAKLYARVVPVATGGVKT